MSSRLTVTLSALVVSACAWQPPLEEPQFVIEYPIAHYKLAPDQTDLSRWKAEVSAFGARMRKELGRSAAPILATPSKEAEFLDRAVDPALLVWRDPRYFWRTPIQMSWWEVIDERGRVTKVYIVGSNQTPEADRRILAWCVNDKLWRAGEMEGAAATPSIRSASINLGESKYHAGYWIKKISGPTAATLTALAIGLVVLFVRHITQKRRDKAERRAKLMRRVHHPAYTPHHVDEEEPGSKPRL